MTLQNVKKIKGAIDKNGSKNVTCKGLKGKLYNWLKCRNSGHETKTKTRCMLKNVIQNMLHIFSYN